MFPNLCGTTGLGGVGGGLEAEQVGVQTLRGHQLVVRAVLGDPAVFQDVDVVGLADAGKTVVMRMTVRPAASSRSPV